MTTFRANNKELPKDKAGDVIPLTLSTVALAQTRDTSVSSSTEITLDSDTVLIEVTAIDDNLYLKYGTDDVTNANFDEFILANTTRHYVIPNNITAINLIDDGNSGAVVVIEK